MALYMILITIGMVLSATLGLAIGIHIGGGTVTDGDVLFTVLITFVMLLLIDAIVAIIVHALPRRWVNPFKKIFKVYNWERKFYLSLGIKHWKDRIPETGEALTGFAKDKVVDMTNNEYVMKFMEETVYAEILHFLSIIFCIPVIFLNPDLTLLVGLPMFIFNAIIQIMPVMVQRYNRPKLMALYIRNQRREDNKVK